jgi:hypothetical protein
MERNISVNRLWSMGQFNNYELNDEVTNIPEKIALNPKAMGLLYNLIIMEMESAHVKYLKLYKDHPSLIKVFPEVLKYFDELEIAVQEDQTKTFEEFMEEYKKEV